MVSMIFQHNVIIPGKLGILSINYSQNQNISILMSLCLGLDTRYMRANDNFLFNAVKFVRLYLAALVCKVYFW